jgi:hypothetical protein
MESKPLVFFPKYFSWSANLAYTTVLLFCIVLFPSRILSFQWIVFGVVEVFSFFYFSNFLTRYWANLSYSRFQNELFVTALSIRFIYVIFSYLFYQFMTGQPFEFETADAIGYHHEAIWIVDLFESGNLSDYFTRNGYGVSDSGFPLWLSIIYFFTSKSIFVARMVNALTGAWMCVLIYKISRRNFGEVAARISAIFSMLLPTLIYYCGLHTKETIMVFFLVAFTERADNFLRLRTIEIWSLLIVVFLGALLFFFRTVLAVAAWFAVFSALMFSSNRLIGAARKSIYILWFVIAAVVVISGKIRTEIEGYVKDRNANQKAQMYNYATTKGANKLAQYGTATVFLPLMLFAPFPTLVYIDDQPNAMMINGNIFTRNVYAFFVLIALFTLYKKKLLTQHILVLSLLLSYLVILALSGFALSERFHMPAVPFLLILAGYGVTQMDKNSVKFYIPYLVFIGLLIIGWNWFKLAGRGGGF